MASGNRPSKDKRNARNKARRQALEARRQAARERAGDDGPIDEPRQSWFSKLFAPRPATTSSDADADADADADDSGSKRTSARSGASGRAGQPPLRGRPKGPIPRDDAGRVPGQRAVLYAVFLAVAAVGFLAAVPLEREVEIDSPADAPEGCEVQDVDEDGDESLTCVEEETVIGAFGAASVIILLPPLAITGVAYRAASREHQSRVWMWCMIGLALFSLPLGIFILPSLGAMTVATFQSRRAEQRLLAAEWEAGLHDGDGDKGRGDVIDTTATDDDDSQVEDRDDQGDQRNA